MADRYHREGQQHRGRFAPTRARVLVGLAVLFGGVIVVNAVALQTEKHPAPMFRSVIRTPESFPVPPARPEQQAAARPNAPVQAQSAVAPRSPQPAVEKPRQASEAGDPVLAEIQQELIRRGHYKGEATGRPNAETTKAIRDFQFAQRLPVDGKPSEALLREITASKANMKNELDDLVKRAAGDDRSTRTIADVQRALNKAGYGPLSEDGQLGPGTRAALTKFEADRKLPPRGEPKGPVLKLLASVSGVPITQ